MLLVSDGTFFMGASAESLQSECSAFRDGCQTSWFSASEPVHVVLLAPYYVDSQEVSNNAYTAFLNETENPCGTQLCLDIGESELLFDQGDYRSPEDRGDHPVTGVTWYGAAAYCEWRGARLPSEAEWERAAAWDDATAVAFRYPWGDDFDGELVNFCDSSCEQPQANADFADGFAETAPVTGFAAGRSPVGAYNMAGNVWEWVSDWYDPDYYSQSTDSNPLGPESGVEKVVRGGSWFDTGNFMASAIRFPSAPDNADRTIGFRCAADLPSIGGSP